jgi:DMSO/TMAO reductase YedYZ molybdopterin-dependent catalytic subunit
MNTSSAAARDVHPTVAPKKLGMREEDAKGAAVKMKAMEMPEDMSAGVPGLLLTMADVRKLPHVEMVTEFKCIEGWSEIVYWGGARLRDFLAAFPPQRARDSQSASTELATAFPNYVGLDTPDGQYYVGIEGEVALHPQTLLAYELNGQPLTPDHGAPLRLVTPLKYGINQLKQIGRITYSNVRPHDYWHEQGYDYYAGL